MTATDTSNYVKLFTNYVHVHGQKSQNFSYRRYSFLPDCTIMYIPNEPPLPCSTCSSGNALPIPSASITGSPKRAPTSKGSIEFIPPTLADINPLIFLPYKHCINIINTEQMYDIVSSEQEQAVHCTVLSLLSKSSINSCLKFIIVMLFRC